MIADPNLDWKHLDPQVKSLWRIEWGISGLVVLVVLSIADIIAYTQVPNWFLPPLLVGLLLGVAVIVWFQYVAQRSYEFWKYALEEDELSVAYGIWWRTARHVARSRIQHVDITSGPIARHFGLAVLSVYVGGQIGAAITIPGLAQNEAEQMRERLIGTAQIVAPPLQEPPLA